MGLRHLGGGLRQWAYSNSLPIVMALTFAGSWIGQSLTGLRNVEG